MKNYFYENSEFRELVESSIDKAIGMVKVMFEKELDDPDGEISIQTMIQMKKYIKKIIRVELDSYSERLYLFSENPLYKNIDKTAMIVLSRLGYRVHLPDILSVKEGS